MASSVVVDTSVWVTYFKLPGSPQRAEVERLLRDDEAVLVGPVLGEILRGIRTDREAATLVSKLSQLRFLETRLEHWIQAGRLGAKLGASGQSVALVDLVIAATAMAHGSSVFTTDPDFRRIPGLTLHQPT